MKRTDTEIHRIELLLTLDYLLKYTDEDHPATQIDICEHATRYGLKYDKHNTAGNDVRRDRIGDCLKFLMKVTSKFVDDVPFVLETTDSGKYYIEQKNYLSEEQIMILAAVRNDKYTKDEDTEFLIERLLDTLSNKYNREHYKNELDKLDKKVIKYNASVSRKFRLVEKAYHEGKMLKIKYKIFDKEKFNVYYFWYRVYFIKEYKNKVYALLIPITTKEIHFYHNYIFEEIERLNIPTGSDRDVLAEDPEPNRNLNELFFSQNKLDGMVYKSIEKMISDNIIPQGGALVPSDTVSFHFRLANLKYIKPSFEEFFSFKLTEENMTLCSSFDIVNKKKFSFYKFFTNKENGDYEIEYKEIVPHELKEGENPKYAVVNIKINIAAFESWLLSDPHGDGRIAINDMLIVVSPDYIAEDIERYYKSRLFFHQKRYEKQRNN